MPCRFSTFRSDKTGINDKKYLVIISKTKCNPDHTTLCEELSIKVSGI